ncbi:unnamed protein product [Mucor hiemalis]
MYIKLINLISFLFTIKVAVAAISLAEKNDILDLHNSIRRIHSNTNALRWSDTLSKNAQSYVEACEYNNRISTLKQYKEDQVIGNVASGFSDWNAVIKTWYLGEKSYNYNDPGYTSKSGTFISMLWKDTTEIGCSSYKCNDSDGILYQCLYSPSIPSKALFDEEEFKRNVLPPTK